MKKVFLDNLPHKGKLVNWKDSTGYKVKFIYDDIEGELEIVGYSNRKLELKYKEHKIHTILPTHLANNKIGVIIGKNNRSFIYDIGDVIKTTDTMEIIILDKLIKEISSNKSSRWYKFKCLNDGYVGEISENHINKRNQGCPVCSNKKVIKGINDIATTHPHLVRYFVNIEDTYKYSYGSDMETKMVCSMCGEIKRMRIADLEKQGFGCTKCGDGISVPEKIMFNVLEQLNVDFKTQQSFKWSKVINSDNKKLNGKKIYDFYFEYNGEKYIIETHGEQHYREGFQIKSEYIKTLKDVQENDKLKEQLAKENRIKHYIVIDCMKNDLEYIKNNIINSQLVELFDLSNIDWNKVAECAYSNLIKEACKLWNSGARSSTEIGRRLKLSISSVCRYLNKGSTLGWCDYDPKKERTKGLKKRLNKKVMCLTTNEIFNSITEAGEKYNFHSSGISACFKGVQKSAGKHPITGEPLRWMYYDEYKKLENNFNWTER